MTNILGYAQYTNSYARTEICFNDNVSNFATNKINIEASAQISCNSEEQLQHNQSNDNFGIALLGPTDNSAEYHMPFFTLANSHEANNYGNHNYTGEKKNNIDNNNNAGETPFTLPFP